ncbi:MAG: XdhC family protein [Candidatus Eremiobacteraeota bacterium]|nr:XdhC family protein [Candidatus Eremiobacteraeota bacterium]
MRDVFAGITAWMETKSVFALATLVATRDAFPAPIGTTMAVDADGRILGTIGAGCYESDIVEACLQTAADGATRVMQIDLASDDDLWIGNGCGGMLEVAVWRPGASFVQNARRVSRGNESVQLRIPYQRGDGERVTFEFEIPARELLVLVGATSLADEIAALAHRLDFRVVVIDARPAFATRERLPHADEILRQWPQDALPALLSDRTPIVLLSHNPKFDLPALRYALQSQTRYVGLLGSRRAQTFYRNALRDEGLDERVIARIRGPVGLDLGGSTTAQTALSIVAEIIAAQHNRHGGSLQGIDGPIHVCAAEPNPI